MRNASGMLRRSPARKTRDGEIGRAPEKMDRTAFPAKTRAKKLEDAVSLNQNAPGSIRISRSVRTMLLVAIEWNRIRDFIWQDVDLDRQAQLVQRSHDRFVKVRYAARFELE